ncbi:MAG: glycosyltransferase family 1 protein [Patescibacteria group bacterium]
MKILVDGRGLLEEIKAGVEGYTYNMLDNLQRMYPENEYILFSYSRGRRPVRWLTQKYKWIHYPWSNMVMSVQWRWLEWPLIDQLIPGIDAVWCPNIRFIPVGVGVKRIVTVHDLSFEVLPECYSARRRLWHWHMNIKENLGKADLIVAVSQKTADDLVDFYDISPQRIKVIYSGVDDRRLARGGPNNLLDKYKLQANYFLHVSTVEPRKNIYSLLKAYSLWRQRVQKVETSRTDYISDLVLVGGVAPECQDVHVYLKELNLKDHVHLLGFVDDEEKNFLMSQAKALLYASYYEGFGFPPLEAMKLNIPVVISFAGSLGEVMGKDCLVVDPLDVGAMVNALNLISREKELANLFSIRGQNLAAGYLWREAASQFQHELNGII